MPRHLQREIERLKKKILELSALVEDSVRKAVKSIAERNADIAQKIIDTDQAIDQMEVDIEEDCLKILALNQPVAIDLRFIVAVLKINNDLERVGDLASNIAERAIFLSGRVKIDIPFDYPGMTELAQSMLKKSLDALVNMDSKMAREVLITDDRIDSMHREMYFQIAEGIRKNPEQLDSYINLLAVSRQLERIADHATNIAEDAIYMIDGEIVRHRGDDYYSNQA